MEEKNNDQSKESEKPTKQKPGDGNSPPPMKRPTEHLKDEDPKRTNKK